MEQLFINVVVFGIIGGIVRYFFDAAGPNGFRPFKDLAVDAVLGFAGAFIASALPNLLNALGLNVDIGSIANPAFVGFIGGVLGAELLQNLLARKEKSA